MTDQEAPEKPVRQRGVNQARGHEDVDGATPGRGRAAYGEAILEEARRGGLLDGGKSAHVSFRVPQGLVEAAKRETGITSTSELGTLALALLAQPDPVALVMKRTRGRLGRDHKLDY